MKVEVQGRRRVFDGFFKLDLFTLNLPRFDGSLTGPSERIVFERGDSAAVLLYDNHSHKVVLVEQFRFPAYLREQGDGMLLEIVAGTISDGSPPEEVARSEVLEEAGYSLERLEPVGCFYVSPGACTERIHLFIARVRPRDKTAAGGGVDEGEEIRIHEADLADALRWVQDGRIRDAKTIIALQHLALDLRRTDA